MADHDTSPSRQSDSGTPEPQPHMVTRVVPGGWNFSAMEYADEKTVSEQRGWSVEGDGLHAWATTPEGAIGMWERMQHVREARKQTVATIREWAENQDYATMSSWRALADRLSHHWGQSDG